MDSWERGGCHPSRFSSYPKWRGTHGQLLARPGQHVSAGSPFFVFTDHEGGRDCSRGGKGRAKRCAARSLEEMAADIASSDAEIEPVLGKDGLIFWRWR